MKEIIGFEHFNKTLKRMTHEIIERNDDLSSVILVGIEKKGTPIASEIKKLIYEFENISIPLEKIDISSFRDDEKRINNVNVEFNEDINNKTIILVDDVLYTGRSVRAAMDAIMAIGRPKKIELAVFIDRGHRELPIRADFVGKNVPTSREELVVCDFTNRQVVIK